MDVRVFLVETAQVRNKKIPADGITGADTELSSAERTGLQNLHLSAFDEIHGRFNVTQKNLPLRCQLHLFCAADKQRLVQLFLQYLDGLADR